MRALALLIITEIVGVDGVVPLIVAVSVASCCAASTVVSCLSLTCSVDVHPFVKQQNLLVFA